MNEIKIKKILLLSVLCLGCSVSIFILLNSLQLQKVWEPKISLRTPIPIKPTVLGETTDIRGSQTLEPAKAYTKGPVSFKNVLAESFLIVDANSGQAMLGKNQNEMLAIGSLTKLMTGLVAYKALQFGDVLTIYPKDEIAQSPSLNLKAGDQVKVSDLFNSMLIGSVNDAALTLANHTAFKNSITFVDDMNKQAGLLHMNSTHFSNPLGFDSKENFSTAADLSKLVLETQSYGAFSNLGKRETYSFQSLSGKTFKTLATNKLVSTHPEISAIKTGSTPEAREAMIVKIAFGSHNVFTIVLNSPDRQKDTLELERIIEDNFFWE